MQITNSPILSIFRSLCEFGVMFSFSCDTVLTICSVFFIVHADRRISSPNVTVTFKKDGDKVLLCKCFFFFFMMISMLMTT